MSVKRKRFWSIQNSIQRLLYIFGIFVAVNYFISPRHFTRADLTEDRLYTITEATKTVLRGLEDNLMIRAYFSEDLPHQYRVIPRLVEDFLAEYKAYGGRRVEVQFLDPNKDEQARTFAEGLGIKPFPIQDRERDKVVVRNCYMTLALFYLDQHEKLDGVFNVEGLEYALTRAIVKITTGELPRVGLLLDSESVSARTAQPNQKPDASLSFDTMFDTLQTQYRVQKVFLQSGQPVPEDIDTLLVVRPRNLTEREVFEVDQFIMRGGRIVFFLDTVHFDTSKNLAETPLEMGLEGLLEHYGFKVRKELVLDESAGYLPVIHQQGLLRLQQNLLYPYWVRLTKENLDSTNPVVNKLGSLVLYWSSPLEILSDKVGDREVIELVRTSEKAWSVESYDNVYPTLQGSNWGYYRRPAEENRDSFLLSAVQIGEFESFFAGKEIPEVNPADSSDSAVSPSLPSLPGVDSLRGPEHRNLPPELLRQLQQTQDGSGSASSSPQGTPSETEKGRREEPSEENPKTSDGSEKSPSPPPPPSPAPPRFDPGSLPSPSIGANDEEGSEEPTGAGPGTTWDPAGSESPSTNSELATPAEQPPDPEPSEEDPSEEANEPPSESPPSESEKGRNLGTPAPLEKPKREVLARSPTTRVMVVTDADIVADSQFNQPASYTFVHNAVDWMALGNELIEIRSRGITDRSIESVEEDKAFWIKVLTSLSVSVLLIVIGILRFVFRSS